MFEQGNKALVLGPQSSGKTVLLCGIYRHVKYIEPIPHVEDEDDLLKGIKNLDGGEWPPTTDRVYIYDFVVGENRSIKGVDTPGQKFEEWTNEIIKKEIRKGEKTKAILKIVALILGSIFLIGTIIKYLHPIFMIISIPLILVPFIIGGKQEETEEEIEDENKEEFYRDLKTSKIWMLTIPANIKDNTGYQINLYNRYKNLLKVFRPKRVGIIITMADLFKYEEDRKMFFEKKHYRDLENFIKDLTRSNYKVFEYCVETENGKPKRFPEGFKVRGVEEILKWLRE